MPQVIQAPATNAEQADPRKQQPAGGTSDGNVAIATGHAVAAPRSAAHLLGLQRLAGNRAVAASLTVSRQNVPTPATDPKFDATTFIAAGPRFDVTYIPVGPAPAQGSATVTMRVHINFQDFTRADARKEPFRSQPLTRSQLADFAWKPVEKESFGRDFQQSVQAGWSAKHDLATNDPTFAEHRAKVQVVVELVEAGKAHNTMTALKIPKGDPGDKPLPRFRSNVDGEKSNLEQRDVSEPETTKVRTKPVVDQIAGFAHDSAAITPDITAEVARVAARIKAANLTFGAQTDSAGKKHDLQLFVVGRATSPGSRVHNDQLGQQRADAVLAAMLSALGPASAGTSATAGEQNATEEEKFRRVDVLVSDMGEDGRQDVTQNTAAHEAGHMFGLDDEYVEEDAPAGVAKKFTGDKPAHFGDVQAELGDDAAQEMRNQDSGSIMSRGADVKRGHYVPFLQAVERATSKQWTVK